jgi:MFS family permease
MKNTIISSLGVIGMIFGSLFSVKFVTVGRRLSAVFLNVLVVLSMAAAILWLDFYVICSARFFFGFASGALVTCANLMMAETIPKEQQRTFAVTVNVGIGLGFMVCIFCGLPLASLTTPEAE